MKIPSWSMSASLPKALLVAAALLAGTAAVFPASAAAAPAPNTVVSPAGIEGTGASPNGIQGTGAISNGIQGTG